MKVMIIRPATLLKRDSNTGFFPVKFARFLITLILKNIWERVVLSIVKAL